MKNEFIPQAKLGIRERICFLGIVFLFPGYLFYHVAVGLGAIPPYLGGYYGFVSLFFLFLLLGPAILRLIRAGFAPFEWSVISLICFCIVWSAAHFAIGEGYQGSIQKFLETGSYLLLLSALFFLGRNMPVAILRRSRLYLAIFLIMVLTIILQIDEHFAIRLIRQADELGVDTSGYQGYARSVIVVALFFLAVSRGQILLVHVAVTTAMLFVIGARSEFAGYVLVVLLMLPYWLKTSRKTIFGASLVIFASTYVVFFVPLPFEVFRVTELIDLDSSTSFVARQELTRAAMDTIVASPILGDYGSDRFGYSHNALGAWVSFGFLGFALYVGLVVIAAVGSFWRVFRSHKSVSPVVLASYCFNMYSLIMIVAAKHVSDPVIALGWGLYAAVLAEQLDARAGHLFVRGRWQATHL